MAHMVLTDAGDRMALTGPNGKLIARAVKCAHQRGMWHVSLAGVCWIDAPLFPYNPVTRRRQDPSYRKCWRKAEAKTQLRALAMQTGKVEERKL